MWYELIYLTAQSQETNVAFGKVRWIVYEWNRIVYSSEWKFLGCLWSLLMAAHGRLLVVRSKIEIISWLSQEIIRAYISQKESERLFIWKKNHIIIFTEKNILCNKRRTSRTVFDVCVIKSNRNLDRINKKVFGSTHGEGIFQRMKTWGGTDRSIFARILYISLLSFTDIPTKSIL